MDGTPCAPSKAPRAAWRALSAAIVEETALKLLALPREHQLELAPHVPLARVHGGKERPAVRRHEQERGPLRPHGLPHHLHQRAQPLIQGSEVLAVSHHLARQRVEAVQETLLPLPVLLGVATEG